MAFNARDLWIVLKARDEATRALNSFSRSVRDAGNAARIAQLEAQRAQAQAAVVSRTHTEAIQRNEIAQLQNQKAAIQNAMAQQRLTGTTQNQVNAMRGAINSIDQEIIARRGLLLQHQAGTNAARQNIDAINGQILTARNAANAADEHEHALRRLHGTLQSVSQVAYTAGFALTALAVGGSVAMFNLVKASAEYERQARLTATQTEGFGNNLKEVEAIGKRVANTIGVGFKEIQPALYDIFSSMDVSVKDSEVLLTGFAKAAVAGQTDIQSVSRGTIGILNSFNLKASDTNRILDLQFEFIRKGVGTYDEWAKRIGLVAPSAVRAGQSLETMMAALASASRMSGVAARAGTAVARAFDAISNSKAADALKKLGISVQDAHGNFRPFIDIMFDIRKHLDKIPGEAAKAAVIQDIFKGAGGTIEARRFINNLLLVGGNLENLQSIYQDTKNAGGSLDKAYAVMADSVAAKTEKLKNKFELFKIAMGDALGPAVSKLLDIGTKLLDWFNNLDPKMQRMAANALLIATGVAAIAGPLAFIIGGIIALTAAFAVAGEAIATVLLIMTGVGLAVAAIGIAFALLYKNSAAFRGIIQSVGDTLKRLWQIGVDTWREIGAAYDKHLKPAVDHLWNVIETQLLPRLGDLWAMIKNRIIPAAKELAEWFKDRLKTAMDMIKSAIEEVLIPALKKFADWYDENRDKIEEFIDNMDKLGRFVGKAAAAFIALGGGAAISTFIAGIGVAIGAILLILGAINWLNERLNELMDWFIRTGQKINEWSNNMKLKVAEAFVHMGDKINQFIFNTLTGLINLFNTIVNTASGYLNTLKTIWSNIWDDIWRNLETKMGGIRSSVSNGISNIQAVVIGGLNTILNIFINTWNNIVSFVGGAINNLVSTVRGGISNVIGAVNPINIIVSIVRNVFAQLPGGASGGISALISLVSGIPGRVVSAIGNTGGLLFSAGSNLVSGFVSGMSSMIGAAASAAAGMAARAAAAARSALGISSPSKVFAKIGRYSIDGFVEGLKANEAMLGQAVNRAFANIVDPNVALSNYIPSTNSGTLPNFPSPPPVGPMGTGRPIYITINTGETDPRRLAEELGTTLAGVV